MAITQDSANDFQATTGARAARERRPRAAAVLGHLRQPTRSSLEFAAKAAIATALAIWLGHHLGLRDSYWAGVSAVVATAGTLGASLGAAVSRISATVVGLAIGLAAFALPVSGVLIAGATVFVALTVLPALSLDAGARLGAGSTLIVTALPGGSAISDALARGANVPLGCAVAVVVGLVLFPHRAAEHLRAELAGDIERAGELIRSALQTYLGTTVASDLPGCLGELTRTSSAHAAALRDAAREPGERGPRLRRLQSQVAAVGGLVDQVGLLVRISLQASEDRAHSLVRDELEAVSRALADTARSVAGSSEDGGLEDQLRRTTRALSGLDGAFADARARRATVDYTTDEITRLLSVIRCVHVSGAALSELAQ
ncbi:MAG TPA: FUSC family protein [Solirubrobacteraceae bacterium]